MGKQKLTVLVCKLKKTPYSKKFYINFFATVDYERFQAYRATVDYKIKKIDNKDSDVTEDEDDMYLILEQTKSKKIGKIIIRKLGKDYKKLDYDWRYKENEDISEYEYLEGENHYTKEDYFKQFDNGNEFKREYVHDCSIHSIYEYNATRYVVLSSDKDDIIDENDENRCIIEIYKCKSNMLIINKATDNVIPQTAMRISDVRRNSSEYYYKKYSEIMSMLFDRDSNLLQEVYAKADIKKAFINSFYTDDDSLYIEFLPYTKKIDGIKYMRKFYRYTQAEIATLLGISQGAYSKYEQGSMEVPAYILYRLSCIYDVSMEYIMGKDEYLSDKETEIHINAHVKYLEKCIEDIENNKRQYILNQVKRENRSEKKNQFKGDKNLMLSCHRRIDKRIKNALLDLLNGLIKNFNNRSTEVIFVRGCGNNTDNNKDKNSTDS